MTDREIFELIVTAVAQVAPNKVKAFSMERMDEPLSTVGLDSLATMELVGVLESELGVTFPDDELTSLHQISDLMALVRIKGSARA